MFAKLLPLALLSGCATGWIVTEASGQQRLLDENVHEVRVPQPGIEEHLTVSLAPNATSFSCAVDQTAPERVYHQAFRYGSRWKKTAAVMFVLEAAAGAALLLTADNNQHAANYLYGGFLALDGALTLPLIFIPRKEIYRTDDTVTTTAVRADCPDGLAVTIGDDTYPIDAAGSVGDLGRAALAANTAPVASNTPGLAPNAAPLRVSIAGQQRELYVQPGRPASVTIPVATGALTSLAP
ncbi:MAG: hypothetical protein JO257_32865 [Deltaproteobacteria bacterium]|nr:hypothetical protein [Deltaproteobacteria bacterium]